jgi:hypothetical protein
MRVPAENFITELEVDSNGVVTEYPGFFENCVGTLSD